MIYPKPPEWTKWDHDRQIEFLERRIETETQTVRCVTGHWLAAADRVKELEAQHGKTTP